MNPGCVDRMGEFKRWLIALVAPPLHSVIGGRSNGTFGILTYHRIVARPPGLSQPTWNVTPARFRSQLEGLLRRGYRPRPLGEVIECRRRNRPVPDKTFVVTFDDGYENVYLNAWPILKELRVPATVFLATAYLDGDRPFPFDDWPATGSDRAPASSWRPLSTGQCAEMLDDGLIELGSHTHTHADFRGLPGVFRRDLLESLDVLRSRFGLENVPFAFPFGVRSLGFAGDDLTEAARAVGVPCALTCEWEPVGPRSDPLQWGRFTVVPSDTGATLAAKLDGWYRRGGDAWRRLKQSFGAGGKSENAEQGHREEQRLHVGQKGVGG